MLFALFGEPIPMFISHTVFIALIITGIMFVRASSMNGILLALIHALYPAIGFFIAGTVDLMFYAKSIGGIYGATPYTFVLFFHIPLMYVISFAILLVAGIKRKTKLTEV